MHRRNGIFFIQKSTACGKDNQKKRNCRHYNGDTSERRLCKKRIGKRGKKYEMTVYLDLLILDNFAADYALLYLAVKTARGEVKILRLIFTALAGTALAVGYTVFTLYYTIPKAVALFAKYGVAALLPVFAAKYKKKSTLAIAVGAFIAYMCAFAGLLTALFSEAEINRGAGLTYTVGGIPSGVLVASAVLFVWLAQKTVAKIAKRKKVLSLVVDCALCNRGLEIKARAFLDSGNMLTAPDGSFVAVAERALAVKLMGDFTGNTEIIRIPVATVNGKSFMTAFKIDKLEIYCDGEKNIIEDVTLGISPDGVQGEYDLILPFDFVR